MRLRNKRPDNNLQFTRREWTNIMEALDEAIIFMRARLEAEYPMETWNFLDSDETLQKDLMISALQRWKAIRDRVGAIIEPCEYPAATAGKKGKKR